MDKTVRDNNLQKNGLWWAGIFLTLMSVGLAPFFRGLFFPTEQMTVLIITSIAFVLTMVWKISQRADFDLPSGMDVFVVLFAISYLIPFFIGPASKNLALIEFLKTLMYLFVFFSISILAYDKGSVNGVIRLLYYSGLAVALGSLGAGIGWVPMKDGFVGGRIFGPLQYPNSTAALLLSGFFLGNYLYNKSNFYQRIGIILSLSTIALAFFGTLSRGALLVLPIVLIIHFLLIPKDHKIPFAFTVLIVFVPTYLLHGNFIRACLAQEAMQGFSIVLSAMGISGALEIARIFILKKIKGSTLKKALKVVFILGILFLAYQLVSSIDFSQKTSAAISAEEEVAVEEPVETVADVRRKIDMTGNSVKARLFWMGESIREITLVHPLFGHGGGAWEASYKSFQSYDYNSTQVHNSWVQILADTGFFGFLSFVGIWLMLIWYGWKLWYKGSEENKLIQATLVAATFTLGGHAVIDFDFSLSCIPLILFTLFAISNRVYRLEMSGNTETKKIPEPYYKKYVIALLGVSLILALSATYMAYRHKSADAMTGEAINYLRENDVIGSMGQFDQAIKKWPYQANRYVDLAKLNIEVQQLEKAERLLSQAEQVEPYDANIYLERVKLAWIQNDYHKIIEATARLVSLKPWDSDLRKMQSDMYILTALRLLPSDEIEDKRLLMCNLNMAKDYPLEYERLAGMRQELIDNNEVLNPRAMPLPVSVLNNAGGAAYILGEFEVSMNYLNKAVESGAPDGITYFWLSLNEAKLGNTEQADAYLEQLAELAPEGNFTIDTIDLYREIHQLIETELKLDCIIKCTT